MKKELSQVDDLIKIAKALNFDEAKLAALKETYGNTDVFDEQVREISQKSGPSGSEG